MSETISSGLFAVIEGPNGVGKTTLLNLIRDRLLDAGCSVLTSKEPTESALGLWIRANQGEVGGRTLACLVAANRYEHIESVVQPALERNTIVLTDRYLTSSFVYQIADGVPRAFVWALNSQCLVPDLTVCLFASPKSISGRMAGRPTLTRFEQSISPETEACLYRQACEYLQANGWLVEVCHNEDGYAEKIAAEVVGKLLHMRVLKNV